LSANGFTQNTEGFSDQKLQDRTGRRNGQSRRIEPLENSAKFDWIC